MPVCLQGISSSQHMHLLYWLQNLPALFSVETGRWGIVLEILKRAEVYFIYSFNWEQLAKCAKSFLAVSDLEGTPLVFCHQERRGPRVAVVHERIATPFIVLVWWFSPRLCAMFCSILSAEMLSDVLGDKESSLPRQSGRTLRAWPQLLAHHTGSRRPATLQDG